MHYQENVLHIFLNHQTKSFSSCCRSTSFLKFLRALAVILYVLKLTLSKSLLSFALMFLVLIQIKDLNPPKKITLKMPIYHILSGVPNLFNFSQSRIFWSLWNLIAELNGWFDWLGCMYMCEEIQGTFWGTNIFVLSW